MTLKANFAQPILFIPFTLACCLSLLEGDNIKEYQNLQIGEYGLRCPNTEIILLGIISLNFRSYEFLPDFERSHS